MATTATGQVKAADRRNQVMVGELPPDFLRAGTTHDTTQAYENEQVGRILQAQQQAGVNVVSTSNFIGRLSISVVQARLTKNYGLTKMDPYCRVRIGHTVFETTTDYNGGKSPKWNRTVCTYLPAGVESFYLELFDEPPENNVYSYTYNSSVPAVITGMAPTMVPQMMPVYYPPVLPQPAVVPMVYPQRPVYPPQQPVRPLYTEEDLKMVKDMFPNMEYEVVKSVMEANHGNKDATINSLLAMSAE